MQLSTQATGDLLHMLIYIQSVQNLSSLALLNSKAAQSQTRELNNYLATQTKQCN
jgi:hypothetical protein